MPQHFSVSRRKLVAFAAGAFAATAGIAGGPITALTRKAQTEADAGAILAASQRRVVTELRNVRRARDAAGRGHAFAAFGDALRSHDLAEFAFGSQPAANPLPRHSQPTTALYRPGKPDAVLVGVIARELQSQSPDSVAWMTRFADLETAIHARLRLTGASLG